MPARTDLDAPRRIHLIAHAGSALKDIARFGLPSAGALLALAREGVPNGYRLTARRRFFEVGDDEPHGGRHDDEARAADLNEALRDPQTLAIVAANGGAYFSRIIPRLDFGALARRRTPLWCFGFSEMTTLVNVVASYRQGRGVYWLCPGYLAWKVRPRERGLRAFSEFFGKLPGWTRAWERSAGRAAEARRCDAAVGRAAVDFPTVAIRGRLVRGAARAGVIRLVGGCISVLAAMVGSPLARRLPLRGRWLAIEDVNEAPYRVDRCLAALKMAGWFARLAGVLVGDFHTGDADQQAAVVDTLRYHARPELPIVVTRDFGHVWPMSPVLINRPLRVAVEGRDVRLALD
ncbi:MAG: hypothetical protein CHACPFDD_02525 [Phycisphaerae bacterium]|nr:hypothetical protein [Phycisphaerae bacterium]